MFGRLKKNLKFEHINFKTMEILEKINRMVELKSEVKTLKNDFQTELFEYVKSEFQKRGFVESPKGKDYERHLYSPETGINVYISGISVYSVSICVIDMVDNGMNWGTAYKYMGGPVSFVYTKETFDKFYQKTYTNRVNKLKEILAV